MTHFCSLSNCSIMIIKGGDHRAYNFSGKPADVFGSTVSFYTRKEVKNIHRIASIIEFHGE